MQWRLVLMKNMSRQIFKIRGWESRAGGSGWCEPRVECGPTPAQLANTARLSTGSGLSLQNSITAHNWRQLGLETCSSQCFRRSFYRITRYVHRYNENLWEQNWFLIHQVKANQMGLIFISGHYPLMKNLIVKLHLSIWWEYCIMIS